MARTRRPGRRNLFRQAAKGSDWQSGEGPRETGRARLRKELARRREQLRGRLRLLFGSGAGGGVSGHLLSYAEIVSDFLVTPLGQLLTATMALTLAYLLIP